VQASDLRGREPVFRADACHNGRDRARRRTGTGSRVVGRSPQPGTLRTGSRDSANRLRPVLVHRCGHRRHWYVESIPGKADMDHLQETAGGARVDGGRSVKPFTAGSASQAGDARESRCRYLRQLAKLLVNEYESAGSGARRREIITELTQVGREWNAAGFQQARTFD